MSSSNDACATVSTASTEPVEKVGLTTGLLPKHFQQAAFLTAEKYVSKIKFSQFKQKYPEFYKHDPAFLQDVYMQLKSQLKTRIEKELENYFKESNLFQKLQDLEELIKETDKSDDQAWRPSGDPNEDIRDHRYQEKIKHKMALEFILNSFKEKVQQLENKVDKNHEEILKMKQEIDEVNQQNSKGLELITDNMPQIGKFRFIADKEY